MHTEAKLLSAAIAAAIGLGLVAIPAGTVDAAGTVAINAKNFPDENFRTYLWQNWDADRNGKLSSGEIGQIEEMNLSYASGITNLKGIEFFTGLEKLNCGSNKIKQINVSKNKKLDTLRCSGIGLEKLNVKGCKSLTMLECSNNNLTSLDVSTNTKLIYLNCSINKLTSLDVSKCTKLDDFYCFNNKISRLDVSSIKIQRNEHSGFANNNAIKELILSPGSLLKLDESDGSAFGFPNNGLKVTWKISSPSVVCLSSYYDSEYGGYETELHAKKPGSVTVTMKDGSGNTKKVTITVAYKDVKSKSKFWYEPTYYLSTKDIVKGYDNQTKFKPNNKCTRAQMVAFLYRLAGEPKVNTSKCKFSDVKKSDYYYKAVIWAADKGITTGYKGGVFKPKNVCTRAQTVTFLWRMAESPNPKTTKNKFKDVKAKDYFYKAVLWAAENNIVAGYKDGTFKPQGKCLRRQMVTFLAKFDKNIYSKKYGRSAKTASEKKLSNIENIVDNALGRDYDSAWDILTAYLGIPRPAAYSHLYFEPSSAWSVARYYDTYSISSDSGLYSFGKLGIEYLADESKRVVGIDFIKENLTRKTAFDMYSSMQKNCKSLYGEASYNGDKSRYQLIRDSEYLAENNIGVYIMGGSWTNGANDPCQTLFRFTDLNSQYYRGK